MTAITANTVAFSAGRTAGARFALLRAQLPDMPSTTSAADIAGIVARSVAALVPFSLLTFLFIAV